MQQPDLTKLNPPAGHVEVARAVGKGVQIYMFDAKTRKWSSPAMPGAFLFDHDNNLFSSHYKGPVWEHVDGSIVRGVLPPAASVSPTADAIAWLRLDAKPDPTRPGKLASVVCIQRVNTKGGKPPAADPKPGEVATIPYEAEYVFYARAPY